MNKIFLFNFEDVEISILYRDGFLGYTFEVDGKHYGNKVKIESKSIKVVANASFLLALNSFETLKAIKQINEHTKLSTGSGENIEGVHDSSESEQAGA